MLKRSKWIASAFIMLPMLWLTVFPAVSAQAFCPEDIFAQWKLDETAPTPGGTDGVYADSIKDNDGTVTVNPTAATGIVGGAQLFTSALPNPTKINVPADNSFDWQADEDFSIEFWMKTDGGIPASNQVIIGRADATPGLFWWVGVRGGSATAEQNGKAAFTLKDTNNAGGNIPGGGTVNLADGDWHHVVAIRDTAQDKIILYVDGATDATLEAEDTTGNTAGFGSTRALTLGWLNSSPFYHFDGLIDEVALYDRVLSPAEILAHRTAGLSIPIGMGVESLRPYPLADAGTDQTVQEGATNVTLNGSGSNDGLYGTIVSSLWTQMPGTAVTLSSTTSEIATFTAPSVAAAGEILTFQLTVTDNDGLMDTATVNVTVNDSSVTPPVTPPVTPSGGGGGGGGCFINTLF